MKIRKQNSILGTCYSFSYTCRDSEGQEYPVHTTIKFGYGRPCLIHGQSITPIDSPERFGQWETPKQRKAYCEAFAAGVW